MTDFEALDRAAGVCWLERSQIEILGRDRARLLHGLCTNDIKRLRPGDGCEAFLTDAQGHTVGYVYVFCAAESLVIDTVFGEAEGIVRGLDRYIVREDVRFVDRTGDWRELILSGPKAGELVRTVLGIEIPGAHLAHATAEYRAGWVSVRRTAYSGPHGFQLSGVETTLAAVLDDLVQAGGRRCEPAAVETARIEAGTPVFGRDITRENLPQEVGRNDLAISFTKGCYLGQETVARIDSLGHVNRLLRGLRFTRELPPEGARIERDGKVVAQTTSGCHSPRLQAPLALAYVRRGCDRPGTRLESPWGEAEVIGLPVGEGNARPRESAASDTGI